MGCLGVCGARACVGHARDGQAVAAQNLRRAAAWFLCARFFDKPTIAEIAPRRRGARGRAASAPQGLRGDRAACQRARASPAGRKQAISALRFKVLLRGRASCKVAALAVIASSCTMRGVCEFCMLADAALRSYDVVKFELQPKRPISCSTHTEKIDIIGLLLEPSSSSDARNLLFF